MNWFKVLIGECVIAAENRRKRKEAAATECAVQERAKTAEANRKRELNKRLHYLLCADGGQCHNTEKCPGCGQAPRLSALTEIHSYQHSAPEADYADGTQLECGGHEFPRFVGKCQCNAGGLSNRWYWHADQGLQGDR